MIYILDNYDSFTYNLVQAVASGDRQVTVGRNDRVTASDILAEDPVAVILSPGPGRPMDSGRMPEIVNELVGHVPILGVCLGHQMLAEHFGARLGQAQEIIHGKDSLIRHDGRGVFAGLPTPLRGGRYHSLAVERASMPDYLEITAETTDGEIMGFRHRDLPIEAVQFHPESILTPHGKRLLESFLHLAAERVRQEAA